MYFVPQNPKIGYAYDTDQYRLIFKILVQINKSAEPKL